MATLEFLGAAGTVTGSKHLAVALALGAATVAHAQQPAQPGRGPMGPGMMMRMHLEMLGFMQQMGEMTGSGQTLAEQMKRMAEVMKEMGTLMGDMASMGGKPWGAKEYAGQMMDRMAEMQKRMSEMMVYPEKVHPEKK